MRFRSTFLWLVQVLFNLILVFPGAAQGPMPEEGATLFPNGALFSYSSVLTMGRLKQQGEVDLANAEPTFAHEIPLTFSWSFRRDLQLSAVLPIVNRRLEVSGNTLSATGLGDALVSLKYRFLRLDSERGTTQASFSFGPKLPTGSTSGRGPSGDLLPVHLQPGSGSTDVMAKLNLTYTGFLNIRRLVADPSFAYLRRTEGTQQTRMGDQMEARLWLHYRPLQTQLVGGEWFIGPSFTWERAARDRRAGLRQPFTGSEVLSAGFTTYLSPRGGLVFWFGLEFPIRQDWNGAFHEQARRLNFGLTKQFFLQP